jgi:hypothetical protein
MPEQTDDQRFIDELARCGLTRAAVGDCYDGLVTKLVERMKVEDQKFQAMVADLDDSQTSFYGLCTQLDTEAVKLSQALDRAEHAEALAASPDDRLAALEKERESFGNEFTAVTILKEKLRRAEYQIDNLQAQILSFDRYRELVKSGVAKASWMKANEDLKIKLASTVVSKDNEIIRSASDNAALRETLGWYGRGGCDRGCSHQVDSSSAALVEDGGRRALAAVEVLAPGADVAALANAMQAIAQGSYRTGTTLRGRPQLTQVKPLRILQEVRRRSSMENGKGNKKRFNNIELNIDESE